METSPSESSCESWWSWWNESDIIPDVAGRYLYNSDALQCCVPVEYVFEQEELGEDELRALAEAEDQAYDELIRECTEELYQDQRDGAATPPLTRTRSSLM